LAKAIEEWKSALPETHPNTKTQGTYIATLERFLAVTQNVFVHKLTADHIRQYRTSRLEDGKKISTVDGDNRCLSVFFNWAFVNAYYPHREPPTKGLYRLTTQQRDKLAKGSERYSLAELIKIFSPDTYLPFNYKPHEYWLPLLALFTGARIEELAQLHLSDIYRLQGFLVVDINDDDGKHLKSEASRRKLPIHPALVELGLLHYLKDVKTAFPNAKRLFPYITPTKHDRLSGRASAAFGRYLDLLQLQGRDKVFHSFRDTVNNEMSDQGVTLELRCATVGHDINHVNIKNYRDDIPLRRLYHECIAKLHYERVEADSSLARLDLSGLKCQPGQFVPRLLECDEQETRRNKARRAKEATTQPREAQTTPPKRRPGRPRKEELRAMSDEDRQKIADRLAAGKARAERKQTLRALKAKFAEGSPSRPPRQRPTKPAQPAVVATDPVNAEQEQRAAERRQRYRLRRELKAKLTNKGKDNAGTAL
jgi:integrase